MKQLILALILSLSFSNSFSQSDGKIIAVMNGETLKIEFNNGDIDSIRLWGIDSPELEQQYGKAALANLESHLHRKVKVEYKNRDKNNFMLAMLSYHKKNGEEVILNAQLVEQGYAWKNKYTDDKQLEKLQKQAKKNKAGLWRNANPTPPWEWRKANN